jgi:hypothetical protein
VMQKFAWSSEKVQPRFVKLSHVSETYHFPGASVLARTCCDHCHELCSHKLCA